MYLSLEFRGAKLLVSAKVVQGSRNCMAEIIVKLYDLQSCKSPTVATARDQGRGAKFGKLFRHRVVHE